jgi:hypothetical protein
MGAGGNPEPNVPGTLAHDYEFAAVELVKPTRMNKVGAGAEPQALVLGCQQWRQTGAHCMVFACPAVDFM